MPVPAEPTPAATTPVETESVQTTQPARPVVALSLIHI